MAYRKTRKAIKPESYSYNGLREFVEAVRDVSPDEHFLTSDREFYGEKFSDILKHAENGNPELVQSFAYALEKVQAARDEMRPEVVRDVVGDYFDVGDFIAGVPECFFRESETASKPVLRVIVNLSTWGGINVQNMQYRGAAIVALIDALQADGYIVELSFGVRATYNHGTNKDLTFDVALGTSPLDIDAVATALANPAFFRRLCFAHNALKVGSGVFNANGGGHINDEIEHAPEDIYFPAFTSCTGYESPEDAARTVQKILDGLKK